MNHDEQQHEQKSGDTPSARNLRRDLAGLALFAAAIFLGVSVFMHSQQPASQPDGSTALVTGLVGLLGFWPLIALSGLLVFLGGRLWVAGMAERLGRNLLNSLALSLALAFLCGAAVAGAGGDFGALLGGNLSNALTIFVGVPVGLALVVGVIWFAWLRAPDWAPVFSAEEPAPSVYQPAESEGLTADEAEALLPAEAPPARPEHPLAPVLSPEHITGRSISVAPDLPPLYPPDVRLEGRIPAGARALEKRDESASARVTQDPAPRPPAAAARAPLAPAPRQPQPEPARSEAAPAALHATPAAPAPGAGGSALPDLAPPGPRWERARDIAPAANPVQPVFSPRAAPIAVTPPVRSAWETEDEDEDVEEIDAVEAELDEPEVEVEVAVVAAAVAAPEVSVDKDEDSEDEFEDDDEPAPVAAELDEDEDDVDDEDSEEDDLDKPAAAQAELEDDEESEDDLDDDLAATLAQPAEPDLASVASVAAEPPARNAAWEQAGLFDDEPVDAYGTPMTLVQTLRKANQATAQRLDDNTDEVEETDEPEAEPEASAPAPRAQRAAAPAAAADSVSAADSEDPYDEYLEDDIAVPAAAEPDEALAAAAELDQPEPEVVLQPREPKPARKSVPKAPSKPAAKQPAPAPTPALDPADDLVYRAGLLFLERGRVAVSMLQRTFELDFKQATALLDQLQQAGLIGPYLGGQRRDILLSAEEWRERRVGAS